MTHLPAAQTQMAAEGLSLEAFEQTLCYTTTASVKRIRQDLKALSQLDLISEKKERRWKILRTIFLVPLGISAFFGFVTADEFGWIVLVPIAVFATLALLCHRKKVAHGRLNLDNRRYQLVDQLLGFLSRDMASDALVELTIDFHSYNADERYREAPKNKRSTTESFSVPWLAMKGRFVDQTRFRLSATQKVKRKERRKRKYTKVKEAFREKVALTLLPDPTSYPNFSQVESLLSQAQVHPDIELTGRQIATDRIVLGASSGVHKRIKGRSATTNQDADQKVGDVHTMLSLFLAAYDCLGRYRSAA